MVEGQNYRFSAASKGYKQYQTMDDIEKLDVGSISSSPPSSKSSDIVGLPCKLGELLFPFLSMAFDLVFARSTCKRAKRVHVQEHV